MKCLPYSQDVVKKYSAIRLELKTNQAKLSRTIIIKQLQGKSEILSPFVEALRVKLEKLDRSSTNENVLPESNKNTPDSFLKQEGS